MLIQPIMPTPEEGSIADTAARARQLLLCCRGIAAEEPQKLAATQLARLNLWASNIGVFASQHASLDYRLRTDPPVKAVVRGNLDTVCKHLLIILKGSSELSKEEFDTFFDTPQSQVSAFATSLVRKRTPNNDARKAAFTLVESKITVLHELSLAIRRASNRDNLTKVPKLFGFDAEYVFRQGQKVDGSNSETVIGSIRFDVGAGLEEFNRKVLTHRWLQYRSSDGEALDKKRHNYRQALLERCVSAVSTRRRQLEYFRAHQTRLGKNDKREFSLRSSGQKATLQHYSQTTVHLKDKDFRTRLLIDHELNRSSHMQYAASNHTQDETVASGFAKAKFKPPLKSLATRSSVPTTADAGFGGDGPFDVPQPPRLGRKEREKACPYCCLVLPAKTFLTHQKEKQWEQHLVDDLQPYVCLFTNCTAPGKTYSSFGAWKSHLSQPHYQSWQCALHPKDDYSNAANKESFTFNTLAEFKSHLKIYHPDCDPMSANDPSQHVRRRAVLPQWCFVCFETLPEPAALLQHMASHFKSMSLLALPWREDIGDNEAIASDKVADSSAADERHVALDTELAGLGFGGEEATGNRARESMRAPHRQRSLFAASLSIVNQSSAPPKDSLHRLETWITELRPGSEIMGPEEAPTRPASPQIESSIDQPSARGHLVFDLEDLENLEASLRSGQCQSKSFTVKEGGSSANDRVVSEFSVNVDGLLWVNGYESCNQDNLGGQPGRQMTLVVLKFTLSSRGLHERFDSMRISLEFEASDSEHWKQPTVEAWAPFGPMDRMSGPETRQKQTNGINEDAALSHSTAGLSTAASAEGELVRPGFDKVHSTVEVHHQTGRPYSITWVLEENNIREADTSLEFNTAVLVSRSSSDPYNAKFDLNAFVGPSREQFNKVRQFTIQQGQPWVCSEGEEMMKNIDLRNLGNLRNREITTMLDIPLGSGYVECHHPRD